MGLKETLIWICLLAVLSFAAQDDSLHKNCSSPDSLLKQLSAELKVAAECSEDGEWSSQLSAELLLSARNLADSLYKHQLKGCQGTGPRRCPEAEVPSNGGLACVTVGNDTYCKPMCNHGYDFAFPRMSRHFNKCTAQTGYKWDTAYIGGNKLAVCNPALLQIAGVKSAYFPKDQDCLTTKSNSQLHNDIIKNVTKTLKDEGIQGEPHFSCFVCG